MHLPRLSTAAILAALGAASTGCVTRTVYVVDDRPSTRVAAAAPAAVVEAPPAMAPADAPAYENDAGISDPYDFVQPLSPYGQWVQYPGHGLVFVPSVGVVGRGFRPYTHGHWEHTEWGWTWVDHHPFGWATGHYGRWFYDAGYGWVWVPGTQWAPAWVSWRTGGGYIGWAAMPPGSVYGGAYSVYDTSWVFVTNGNFGATYVGGVLVTGSAYRTCYVSTRPSRSTVVVYGRNTYRGPDYEQVRRETRVIHRPIRETERDRPVTRPPSGTVISRDRDRDDRGSSGRDRDRNDGRSRDRDDPRPPSRDGGRDDGRTDSGGRGRDRDDNGHGNDRGGYDPSNPGRSDGVGGGRDRDGNDRGNGNDRGQGRDRDDNGHGNDRGGSDPSNPGRSDGVGGGNDRGGNDRGGNDRGGNDRDDRGQGNDRGGNDRDDRGQGNDRGGGQSVTSPGASRDPRLIDRDGRAPGGLRGVREEPPTKTYLDDPSRFPSAGPEAPRGDRSSVTPARPIPERPAVTPQRPVPQRPGLTPPSRTMPQRPSFTPPTRTAPERPSYAPSRPAPERPTYQPRPTPPSRIEGQPSRVQPPPSRPSQPSSSQPSSSSSSKKSEPAKSKSSGKSSKPSSRSR
jgi:hypothetical protein